MKSSFLLLTCEHAVNTVPQTYQGLFQAHKNILDTHHAYDLGALPIARFLQHSFGCPLIVAETTRLLIDCNRSLSHKTCFSTFTRHLTNEEKKHLVNTYYLPFREKVTSLIAQAIKEKQRVWHLSIHSFTPILDGKQRNAQMGLLYDPARPIEKKMTHLWSKELKTLGIKARKNYPYKGTSDGFTTELRKAFAPNAYVGIEVETNQALSTQDHSLALCCNHLSHTLQKTFMIMDEA